MAKLKSHGLVIGKIDWLTFRCAYMSDGKILQSFGSGWKRYKFIKDNTAPELHFQKRLADLEQRIAERPAWAEYRRTLHRLVSLSNRSRVHQTIEMVGNDVDGCWSELNDYRPLGLDLDEVADLCRKFQAMMDEAAQIKELRYSVVSATVV